MYLIPAEEYGNADVHILIIKKTGEIWPDTGSVKNISDLISKEIYGIWETKSPKKEQINKYKMTER